MHVLRADLDGGARERRLHVAYRGERWNDEALDVLMAVTIGGRELFGEGQCLAENLVHLEAGADPVTHV
jgi:hypothetical protein